MFYLVLFSIIRELKQLWNWRFKEFKDTGTNTTWKVSAEYYQKKTIWTLFTLCKARILGFKLQWVNVTIFFGIKLVILVQLTLQSLKILGTDTQSIARQFVRKLKKLLGKIFGKIARHWLLFFLFWKDLSTESKHFDIDETALRRKRKACREIADE